MKLVRVKLTVIFKRYFFFFLQRGSNCRSQPSNDENADKANDPK